LLILACLRIDHCQVAKHNRTVDSIFRDRPKFHRTTSFPDCIVLAIQECLRKTEVRMDIGNEGRLLDR